MEKNIVEKIHRLTVPLFVIKEDNEPCTPMPLATGILFSADDRHFLLSAGHVFTGEKINTIGVHLPDSFYTFKGELFYMPTNDEAETSNRKADIAIYELDEQTYKDLSPYYTFISINDVKMDYIPSKDSKCIFMGYPASKCKTWFSGGKQTSKIWGLKTKFVFDSEVFERLHKDSQTNYLVECHYRKLQNLNTGKMVWAPKPKGMSGCGLWTIIEGEPKLIGIMNEYDKTESVYVATKIDFYTEFLRQKLGVGMEESMFVIDYSDASI